MSLEMGHIAISFPLTSLSCLKLLSEQKKKKNERENCYVPSRIKDLSSLPVDEKRKSKRTHAVLLEIIKEEGL